MSPAVRRVPDLVYGEVPGYRPLELDLYLPQAGGPAPVIVHVHGGGWRRGSRRHPLPVLGADFYEADNTGPVRRDRPRLGIGRDVVLDRVIVDKNARIGDGARLVNDAGVQRADGDGYYIRDGVIIVPKDGIIKPGTSV